MRKKKLKFVPNTFKNILLVLLTCSMVGLMLLNWNIRLQQAGMTSGFLTWLQNRMPGGYIQKAGDDPAAYPVRMAMTAQDGTLVGLTYKTSNMASFYQSASLLYAEAFDHAEPIISTDVSVLKKALLGDTLVMQYQSDLPLRLLMGWLDVETKPDLPYTASTLLLTKDGQLFLRSNQRSGALYYAKTQVDSQKWDRIRANVTGVPVEYASAYKQYGVLYPETLISGKPVRFDILKTVIPDFNSSQDANSLQTLLEAFHYNAYMQYDTEDNGDTQVFVENYSTLRVSKGGKIRFRATAMTGGLSAYQNRENAQFEPLVAEVDFANQILKKVMRAVCATSDTTLNQVKTLKDGTCMLTFQQCVGGIPVQMKDGRNLATFGFQNGVLISAELWLRSYQPTGEQLWILPEEQIASALPQGKRSSYLTVYTDDDSGRTLAKACVQTP